jgi:hypothetical protein
LRRFHGADLLVLFKGLRTAAVDALPGLGQQREFDEGEGECTSELRPGQFSIFGAVEENRCERRALIFEDQENSFVQLRARERAVCSQVIRAIENLVQLAAGLSTGRAQEMQKGSPRGGA